MNSYPIHLFPILIIVFFYVIDSFGIYWIIHFLLRYVSASSLLIDAARSEAIGANDVVTTTPHEFRGPVDMRPTTPKDQGTQFVKSVAFRIGVGAAI